MATKSASRTSKTAAGRKKPAAAAKAKPAAKKTPPRTAARVAKKSAVSKKPAAGKKAPPAKTSAGKPKGSVRTATSLPMPATVTVGGKLYAVGEYGGLMEIDEEQLRRSRATEC